MYRDVVFQLIGVKRVKELFSIEYIIKIYIISIGE